MITYTDHPHVEMDDSPQHLCRRKGLYLLARQHFTPHHAAQIIALCQQQSPDWSLLLQMAEEHLVAPLIYTNLLQCLDPAKVALRN